MEININKNHIGNWYNYLNSSNLNKVIKGEYRGEYWIVDGTAIFADGDVGDTNHEGYVILHAQNLLYEGENWETGKREMAREIWEVVEGNTTLLAEATTYGITERTCEKDAEEVICEFGEKTGVLTGEKWELFTIANGNYSNANMDLRDYAMKNWGWKAVRGNSIQTWHLTSSDMRSIANGLYDIVGEVGGEEEEEEEFSIEIMSNHKYFSGIPMKVIESRNPAAVLTYRQVAFG